MGKNKDCIFCKIAEHQIPAVCIYESDNVIAFLDISPIEKGHLLVVPKRHWPSIAHTQFESADDIACYEELMYIVRCAAKAVSETISDGVNILQANGACAGQTVPHLHFHVIPRYGSGETKPAWESGAAVYSDDGERNSYAERISKAVKKIIETEDIL